MNDPIRAFSILILIATLDACATAQAPRSTLPPVVEGEGAPPPEAQRLPPAGERPGEGSAGPGGGAAVVRGSEPESGLARAQPLPPQSNARPTQGSAAVVALLGQARTQAARGEGEQAAATLERAIRIEPRNAWLWHRLAVLRWQQRRYREAVDLAVKSNTLGAGDSRLAAANNEVISRSCRALGSEAAGTGACARTNG